MSLPLQVLAGNGNGNGNGAGNGSWGLPQYQWLAIYRLRADYLDSGLSENRLLDQRLLFDFSFPLVDARLGTAETYIGFYRLDGSLKDKVRGTKDKDSKGGVNMYGLRLNLFPYRKFPTSIYFEKSISEYLYSDSGGNETTTRMGADMVYCGGYFENLRAGWSHQKTDYAGMSSRTDQLYTFLGKTYGRTRLSGSLTAFDTSAGAWGKYNGGALGLASQTDLPLGYWYNQLSLSSASQPDGKYRFGSLSSIYSNRISSKTNLYGGGGYQNEEWFGIKTDLFQVYGGAQRAMEKDLLTVGGSASSSSSGLGGEGRRRDSQFQLYTSWMRKLTSHLSFVIDASGGSLRTADRGSEGVLGFHAGLGWGSESLPNVIKKMAFFVQEISFQRRMYEEFPPGYEPVELEIARTNYEAHRMGAASASVDYYHLSGTGDIGIRADILKAQGRFNLNTHMSAWLNGQVNRERDRFGQDRKLYNASMTLDYSFHRRHRFYLSLSASRTDNMQSQNYFARISKERGSARNQYSGPLEQRGAILAYDYNRFYNMPISIIAEWYKLATGQRIGRYRLIIPFTYGRFASSLLYEYSRMDNSKIHRISVDLSRLFASRR